RYPMNISVTNGGVMELPAQEKAESIFQAMSNELANPGILVCPADKNRWPASGFSHLTSSNINYFVNVDASESNPQDIMLGDDNLEINGVRVKSGLLIISNGMSFRWTADRHGRCGNLGMADGSVQSASNSGLSAYASNSTPLGMAADLRLAIP
ncbi:MAG TPA: hypothetical protein VL970_13180, partial [Candidatus Acidoferrales bacterium]|nr:hypothetical protein [Candidatus Acidoferrales bacterium]